MNKVSKKLIIMIPARIGSKGIPQKVIRPFNDMPLIYYSIKLALKVPNAITYLNTDSKLIKEVVENEFKSDIKIFIRDKKLGNDSVTLDELTLDFLKKTKINNGTLVTLQPTSPLLSFKSLKLSLKKFNAKNYKTLITVKENTKLEWEYDNKGDLVPTYKNRLNRQFIKPKYSETGSILISDIKETLVTKTRVNNKIGVFELNAIESIDIDSSEDWLFAESLSSSRKIVFFTSANKKLGSGHLKRCLSLAFNFLVSLCAPIPKITLTFKILFFIWLMTFRVRKVRLFGSVPPNEIRISYFLLLSCLLLFFTNSSRKKQ